MWLSDNFICVIFTHYLDIIAFCVDIYLVFYPEYYLYLCSFEEKDLCKKILEKVGLTGYQVELGFD